MSSQDTKLTEKPAPAYIDSNSSNAVPRSNIEYDEEKPRERKKSVVSNLKRAYSISNANRRPSADGTFQQSDETHRKLKPRHVQLIGVGGTIGTALYVQIGQGLLRGGPGSLFLAFTIW